jgi:D-3-phosphoglycerate dehydrogenase / 2-oxoglutarate reductase
MNPPFIVAFIDTVHPILWNRLKDSGFHCVDLTKLTALDVKNQLSDVHGIVIRSKITLDQQTIDLAPNLRFIARSGAGLENIDVAYAQSKNIRVYSSPEGNKDAVGEHVIGMLLMLFNKLKMGDSEVRKGIWRREENRGLEIQGKTIAIIGYGNMGSALAKKLSGFDCRVIAYDKYKKGFSNERVEEVSLQEVFEQADIVSLHLPQTVETLHFVNKEFISQMQKPFYLINTARGKNVCTDDLAESIQNGKVLGVCLDVLEFEKPSFENIEQTPDSLKYLFNSDKVIFSPHVAGWTEESYFKLSSVLADKILADER